MNNQLYAKNN